MEIVSIPNTDLRPSALCLGTAGVGVKNTEEEAHALLDAFVAHGGNFIDTARVYSNWVPGELNRSERIIGDWLAKRRDRNRLIIATKGGHPALSSMGVSRLSREEIEADVNGSLEKLRTEVIDLFWLHRDDVQRPVAEMMDVLHDVQQAGKVRYYACSNWKPARIREADAYARAKGYAGFVGNQMRWSIGSANMRPSNDATMAAMDRETYDFHVRTGLAAIPYSSQAGGFFTKLSADPETRGGYATDANRALHRDLLALSGDLGLTISQIVLAYLRSHPFTTVPIVGCRTLVQLEDSLKAVGHRLPEDVMRRLAGAHGLPFA